MAKKIFIDMDGTVAQWEYCGSPDIITAPGYFRNRPVMEGMVNALEMLSRQGYEMYIVSAVFEGQRYRDEKNGWLDEYMPYIRHENRIYVTYGESKLQSVKNRLESQGVMIEKGDIFLDDYTKNLWEFTQTGIEPVKVLNGINDTHKSWTGFRISSFGNPSVIAKTIDAVSNNIAA